MYLIALSKIGLDTTHLNIDVATFEQFTLVLMLTII